MSTTAGDPDPADAGAFYDDVWQRYGHLDADSPAAFHRRRLVVALACQSAGGARRVLDAGCGQGELLEQLARALPSATIDGADVSEQSLNDTRRRSPGRELFQLDLATPDFEHAQRERLGRYDLVVCSEVIEHILDDGRAARNLHALLAPGGAAVVTVPGGKMSRFDELIGHHRHYRTKRLARLLTDAGFTVERVLAWGFPFHNLYRTAVRVASGATMPKPGAPAKSAANDSGMSRVLGGAYSLFGRGLKPLFYLNLSRWGEQMIAVARRS